MVNLEVPKPWLLDRGLKALTLHQELFLLGDTMFYFFTTTFMVFFFIAIDCASSPLWPLTLRCSAAL